MPELGQVIDWLVRTVRAGIATGAELWRSLATGGIDGLADQADVAAPVIILTIVYVAQVLIGGDS